MERITRRVVLPVVGLATAAVTTTAGILPAVASTSGEGDNVAAAANEVTATDGTYESCSAYFGYGKEDGATELVEFDTAVNGGTPKGEVPTVLNGQIGVVLVITGSGGDAGNTVTCIPEQVTEAEWNAAWYDGLFDGELALPPYPGPGHYVYPTALPQIIASTALPGTAQASRPTVIPDIGDVTSVAFNVTSIPDGYGLVSPTGSRTLQQNAFQPYVQLLQGVLPPALAQVVAAGPGGTAAVEALEAALVSCRDDDTLPDPTSEALTDALESLIGFIGVDVPVDVPVDVDCGDVYEVLALSAYLAGVLSTTEYSETITVSLPVEPTTTSTTTPPAARPTVVTPRFTG